MIDRDTDQSAHAQQIAVWRRMSGEQRLQLGISMSDEAREISLAGIRARHPEYGAGEARDALIRLLLGDALFRAAYPTRPALEP
jgi:hypothetical protein